MEAINIQKKQFVMTDHNLNDLLLRAASLARVRKVLILEYTKYSDPLTGEEYHEIALTCEL